MFRDRKTSCTGLNLLHNRVGSTLTVAITALEAPYYAFSSHANRFSWAARLQQMLVSLQQMLVTLVAS